ncbi:MAG: hypothetical protein NDI75_01765 [Candidatus Didemnitutus sp.]|nr:hypothetical protein [Candidatus Didemnitutus sp.]
MNFAALSAFIYEDLEAQITDVSSRKGSFEIRIGCDDPKEDRRRHFVITCAGVKEVKISPDSFGGLSLAAEHPVLFDYIDDLGYLAFSSAPSVAEVVVARLYEAHQKICSDWRPFSRYANHHTRDGLVSLVRGGFGMLAQGPYCVMSAYQEAVGTILKTSLVKHEIKNKTAVQAVFLDDHFVIAEKIEAHEEKA